VLEDPENGLRDRLNFEAYAKALNALGITPVLDV
jgi:hypothetical protein